MPQAVTGRAPSVGLAVGVQCDLLVMGVAGGLMLAMGCGEEPPVTSVDLRPRVEVVQAAPAPTASSRSVSSTATAWLDAWLTPMRAGRVVSREAEPGDRLREGAPILELDARDARAMLASAEAALADAIAARDEVERRKGRVIALGDGASDAQRDEVLSGLARAEAAVARAEAERDRARVNLADHTLRAPFDGELVSLDPEVGESVGTSSPIARMVDARALRVEVGLLSDELEGARAEGAAFEVQIGGRAWPAELVHVAPAADPRTGTWLATLRLAEGPAPGTPVTVGIQLPRVGLDGAVSLPREALHEGVVHLVEDGRIREVAVDLVDARGARVLVAGLPADARVVTFHNDPLSEGDEVVVVEPPP